MGLDQLLELTSSVPRLQISLQAMYRKAYRRFVRTNMYADPFML